MARKQGWVLVSRKYVAYMLVVSILCAALVLLQQVCMTHVDGDFITGYCLTDTHMRTVIAAILTLVSIILTAAVTSAVEAYRTTRLFYGINEGAYIAMASQNGKYLLRALLTPWAPIILIIILGVNAPQSLQTLVNLSIRTAGVYVRNRSTASVYNAYSYYNATLTPFNFATLDNAITVMTKMGYYRTSATSKLAGSGHSVMTSVLRDGYLENTRTVDGDVTNAFKRLETVASVSSSCTSSPFEGPLSSVVPFDPASVNITSVEAGLHYASASVYTLLYDVMPDGSILFNSTFSVAICYSVTSDCSSLSPNTVVAGVAATCLSKLQTQDQNMIYTVSAGTVTPVQLLSNVTTVSAPLLAKLIVSYADSIESTPEAHENPYFTQTIDSFYASFSLGPFNDSLSNIQHTKLCASASIALSYLFSSYGLTSAEFPRGMLGLTGNADLNNTADVPLYNIVQLTHISTADIAVIAGVITGCACLVSVLGMFFAITSVINIKPATDSSLLYNADTALIAKKQALQSYLSNDPDKQRDLEFDASSMLYSRDVSVIYPSDTYHRVNVSHAPAPADGVPTKSQLYC